MPEPRRPRYCLPREGAVVDGMPAVLIGRVLRNELPRYLPAQGWASPMGQRLLEVVESIEWAGAAWQDAAAARASDIGSAEGHLAEVPPSSLHDDTIDVRTAAGILGVGERRVRMLIAEGALGGRRDREGGPWRLSRAEVVVLSEGQAGGA